jgi:hypothetical protein
MSSVQAFNLRPSWRLTTPKKQQKVARGESSLQKNVKNEGRSDYVYENKQNMDKMPRQNEGHLRKSEADFAAISSKLPLCGNKLPVDRAVKAGSLKESLYLARTEGWVKGEG